MTNLNIFRPALFITGIFLCSSCTTIGELPNVSELKDKIENIQPSLQHLPTNADIKHFAECMAPLAANINSKFLIDELGSNGRRDLLIGQTTTFSDNTQNLREHLDELIDKLVRKVKVSSATDPQGLLFQKEIEQHINISPIEKNFVVASTRSAAYLKAYFRKSFSSLGHLDSLDKVEQSRLQAKVANVLQRTPDDFTVAQIVDELSPQLQKNANDSSGYISRDGTTYTFPGITAQNTQTNIDHSQIEADLIRIILEALSDAYAPLPVLASSTATTIDNTKNIVDFSDLDPNTPVSVIWYFDHHQPSRTLPFTITANQFQDMEAKARSTEASVAGIVGKAIRGGSWGSLNNEALARSIETAAGVLARHTTERIEWCKQALQSPQP